MQVTDATRIKHRVRSFFEKGYKSCNKEYDPGFCLNLEKVAKRAAYADESSEHRLNDQRSAYTVAERLLKMPPANRAGNCGEMAALSAYWSLKTELIRRDHIYVGAVTAPGDHAFCLVAGVQITKGLRFASVKEFTRSSSARAWVIIDPWLNVACSADRYLIEGGQKLDKWTSDGKRICWHGGADKWGWYAPNGDYKDKFTEAPVILMPF